MTVDKWGSNASIASGLGVVRPFLPLSPVRLIPGSHTRLVFLGLAALHSCSGSDTAISNATGMSGGMTSGSTMVSDAEAGNGSDVGDTTCDGGTDTDEASDGESTGARVVDMGTVDSTCTGKTAGDSVYGKDMGCSTYSMSVTWVVMVVT